MSNCPQCGSSHVGSNKILTVDEGAFARGVQAARATNVPALTVGVMAAWALHRGVNALRHEYRCNHCDHRFS